MGSFDQEKHLKPLLAGIFILLLLCGLWVYSSYRQRLERLDGRIASARSELLQFNAALQEYRELESRLQRPSPRNGAAASYNLISTVEAGTERIAARSQLLYVRPQPDKVREDLTEEGVEIKLEKLQLSQLVELLYQFDQAEPPLKVSQLRVRTRFDSPELLDTGMLLSRFRENR